MRKETITAEKIEKVIDTKKVVKDVWEGMNITIKPTLTLAEVLTMVSTVVKTCFSEEEGTYLPEVKDFAIKKCILEIYANIKLSNDPSKDYDIIYNSDLVDFIMANINRQQFSEIMAAIDSKIEYTKQTNVSMINHQMNELLTSLGELSNKISDIFSGVNSEDIGNLVQAISNGGFDMDALIQAAVKEAGEHSKGTAVL